MVVFCFGCRNNSKNNPALGYFRFPKDDNRCVLWFQAINKPKQPKHTGEFCYTNLRLCSGHFQPKDVNLNKQRKRLDIEALPICNPATITDKQTPLVPSCSVACHLEQSEVPEKVPTQSCPKKFESSQSGSRRKKTCFRQEKDIVTPKAKYLHKRLVTSCSKIIRGQQSVASFKKRLANARKFANSKQFKKMIPHLNKLTFKSILPHLGPRKLYKFTLDEKILALRLFVAMGFGYRLLSVVFGLPSNRTLNSMLNSIPLSAGTDTRIFEILENSVADMKTYEKYCAVVFGETTLSSELQYNIKEDCIDGIIEDTFNRKPALANHVTIFMIKGLFRRWKQPLAFLFSNGPIKSEVLKRNLKEVITNCQQIGLKVVCSVCDQGATNQAVINDLLRETSENSLENIYFVNGQEVVPLYDIPGLFKDIRNNFLTKDLHYVDDGEIKIAKWEHIVKFYYMDCELEDRLCDKLTDQHVLPDKVNKTIVRNCTQLFSYKVGSLMKRISKWGCISGEILPQEAGDTADFILFMDRLFDSCNSESREPPHYKPLKRAATANSNHEEFWEEAIANLENMSFFCPKENTFENVQSLKLLVVTLRGFMYLKNLLLKDNRKLWLRLRVLNRDCLENFITSVKSLENRITAPPSVTNFVKSVKAEVINNCRSTSQFEYSNCERDKSVGLLDNLRSFIGKNAEGSFSNYEINEIVSNRRRLKLGKHAVKNICSYLGKKLLSYTRCKACVANISQIRITNSDGYRAVSRALFIILYLMPKHCHKIHLSNSLELRLKTHSYFKQLACVEHPDLERLIIKLIVRCGLQLWCREINNLLANNNKEQCFRNRKRIQLLDPMKFVALKKYERKNRINK